MLGSRTGSLARRAAVLANSRSVLESLLSPPSCSVAEVTRPRPGQSTASTRRWTQTSRTFSPGPRTARLSDTERPSGATATNMPISTLSPSTPRSPHWVGRLMVRLAADGDCLKGLSWMRRGSAWAPARRRGWAGCTAGRRGWTVPGWRARRSRTGSAANMRK